MAVLRVLFPLFPVLLLVLRSGCLSTGVEEPTRVPEPGGNLTYVYAGDAGGRLQVDIEGDGWRYDATLAPVESTVMNASVAGVETSSEYWVTEAVGRSGQVVQHSTDCGDIRLTENGSRRCADDRVLVEFDAMGYPGGFGAAPFWGEPLPRPGPLEREAPFFATADTVEVTVRDARDGCVEVEGPSWDQVTEVPPIRFAVHGGPVLLCEQHPLPVRFTDAAGATWTLVEVNGTESQAEADLGPRPEAHGPVPTRPLRTPLVPADPSDPSPFSVEDAHRAALDHGDSYPALFDQEGTLLVGAHYRQTAQGPPRQDQRTLTAVAPDGEAVEATVHRTTADDGPAILDCRTECAYHLAAA